MWFFLSLQHFSYCGCFPRAQLAKLAALNLEPMLLLSTMKSYPKTKVITQVLCKHYEMNFTSRVYKWNNRLEEKSTCPMETKQRSEQSLCLLDFWTSTTPKSHFFKLKCEKVNRKSTLCKTRGHTRSAFYKFSASEAELQDQRFIGSSC